MLSENQFQNLSNYVKILSNFLNLIKKVIISSDKMRNSGNYDDDYVYSFFGNDL